MKLRMVPLMTALSLMLLFMNGLTIQAQEIKCGDWSGIICREYGCQAIACIHMGGKIAGQGLVMNQAPLKKLGFTFGEGPYKASFQRLNPGRYVISLQAMTRPNDRQEKLVKIKTAADAEYPRLDMPAFEPGKYTWNQAIEYDIEYQLGIKAHYEKIRENVSFIDLRVVAPEKLTKFGFPLLAKNDTRHQLLYKGDNRWQLSSSKGDVGPILVYESWTWKTSGSPRQSVTRPPQKSPKEKTALDTIQPASPLRDQKKPIKPLPTPPDPALPEKKPVHSLPTIPSPTSQKVTMERNVERPGGDYKSFTLDKGDPGLCAHECENDPGCMAFTYYRPGLRGKKALCSLKLKVTPKKGKGGCYSGVKQQDQVPGPIPTPPPPPPPVAPGGKVTMERNVERPGGDYKIFPLDKGDPGLCAHECEKDPGCMAFTYYRPGLRGKKALCSLKQKVTPKKGKGGCYSGIKQQDQTPAPIPTPPPPPVAPGGKVTMERNVERLGGDYRNFNLDKGDPGLCAHECEQDPRCLAFTYYRPGLRGKKALCSLKQKVTPKRGKGGCYSGVKQQDQAPAPVPTPPPPPVAPGGKVTMERNVERLGGDYRNFNLDKGDPGLCAHECEQDPRCLAFTYYRPGLRGKKALCSLKQKVTPKRGKGGCYSGVKQQE